MARLEQHPVKPALRTTCEDCNVKPAVRPPTHFLHRPHTCAVIPAKRLESSALHAASSLVSSDATKGVSKN